MSSLATIYETVRELRKSQTKAESTLWQELKAHRFKGYKFRRQHPIIYFSYGKEHDYFIADFYCAVKRLVVEIDGSIHDVEEIKERDNGRQQFLEEEGYIVIRFTNDEVFKDILVVLDKIEEVLK